MLSFLPSPFASSASNATQTAETSSKSAVARNKSSNRRKASAMRGPKGGQTRGGQCRSTLGPLPAEHEQTKRGQSSSIPEPLMPTRSTFNSPVKPAVDDDEEDEELLEAKLGEASQDDMDDETLEALQMMEEIESAEELYAVLGVVRGVPDKDLRRAYMGRCRTVHPDKQPSKLRPMATAAFQSLSYAYETLSSPASRKAYDVQMALDARRPSTPKSPRQARDGKAADETLNGVLHAVWCEFLDGDFEMIRSMVGAINETTPAVHVGDQTVETIQGALERLRGALLAGGKYMRVVRFELIRLYEIQLALRQLGWFDIKGRVRLTIQLARVTISIPLAIDKAMQEDAQESNRPAGLLGARVSGMLGTAVGLLEGSEAWLGGSRYQVAERAKA